MDPILGSWKLPIPDYSTKCNNIAPPSLNTDWIVCPPGVSENPVIGAISCHSFSGECFGSWEEVNDSRLHLTRGNHIVGEIKRVSTDF